MRWRVLEGRGRRGISIDQQNRNIPSKLTPGRAQIGQSLVELAVLLPIMLLFTFGAIDLGRVFRSHVIVTSAAREAAFHISLHPDDIAGAENAAKAELGDVPATIVVTPATGPGALASAEVRATFRPITAQLLGVGTLTLRGQVSMVQQ